MTTDNQIDRARAESGTEHWPSAKIASVHVDGGHGTDTRPGQHVRHEDRVKHIEQQPEVASG
jgi:hypothetical protein